MTPEEMQKALDAAEVELAEAIKRTDGLIDQAKLGADALCRGGDFEASKTVREMEAKLRAASAELTGAYAIGRGISTRGGGK